MEEYCASLRFRLCEHYGGLSSLIWRPRRDRRGWRSELFQQSESEDRRIELQVAGKGGFPSARLRVSHGEAGEVGGQATAFSS